MKGKVPIPTALEKNGNAGNQKGLMMTDRNQENSSRSHFWILTGEEEVDEDPSNIVPSAT